MKYLITTIAAVVLVGCGESQPTAKAPDISIHEAARDGNIEAVKQHLIAGTDINEKDDIWGQRPLHQAIAAGHAEIAKLSLGHSEHRNKLSHNGNVQRRDLMAGKAKMQMLGSKKENVPFCEKMRKDVFGGKKKTDKTCPRGFQDPLQKILRRKLF